jgi:hypothetical protein
MGARPGWTLICFYSNDSEVGFLFGTGEREFKMEASALPDLTFNFDGASVFADDAVDDGQAQAGALLRRLGGEERIEDAAYMLRRNAASIVGDIHAKDAIAAPGFHGEHAT